jgi:DNA-binding MarR family transcriptional regulator
MALRRTYTFSEAEGLSLVRLKPTEAASQDRLLAPLGLSNWQLAALYVVGLEVTATSSDIGFALVMDRPTVAEVIRPLEKRQALRKVLSIGSRKDAVALTDSGVDLLEDGLKVWREAHDRPNSAERANDRGGAIIDTAAKASHRIKVLG